MCFEKLEAFLQEMRQAKLDAIEQGFDYLDPCIINMYRTRFSIMIDKALERFPPA